MDEKEAQYISSILNTYQNLMIIYIRVHLLIKTFIKEKIACISSRYFIIQTTGSIIFYILNKFLNTIYNLQMINLVCQLLGIK